jgi:Holliday junction resolvasome RuvABC ATP-dependent DNA helicase subunit
MSTEQDKNQLTENERTKLLKVIGLLAETFANTNKEFRNDDKSIVYGSGDMGKTGKTNIINELLTVSGNLKHPPKGLGKTTLQDVIKSGVKVLNNES